MTPTLSTERLILREVRESDLDDVFDCWMQDEDVSRYMWWKASKDKNAAKEFIDFEMQNLENPQWNRWMILLKDSGIVIGTCLIFFNDEDSKDKSLHHWDISYNLGRKFWGKGYAYEAMKRVLEYAKREMGIKEISTTYATLNEASGHLLSKLGFKCEKDVPYICSAGEFTTSGKYCRCIL